MCDQDFTWKTNNCPKSHKNVKLHRSCCVRAVPQRALKYFGFRKEIWSSSLFKEFDLKIKSVIWSFLQLWGWTTTWSLLRLWDLGPKQSDWAFWIEYFFRLITIFSFFCPSIWANILFEELIIKTMVANSNRWLVLVKRIGQKPGLNLWHKPCS